MRFLTLQQRQTIALFIIFFALDCGAENTEKTFVKTADFALTSSFKTMKISSKVRCVGACAKDRKCFSATYSFSTAECRMSELPLIAIAASGAPNNDAVTFSLDEWLLVFRATPGIFVDAKGAWLYGSNVTTSNVTCQVLSVTECAYHYRHPVVDLWNVLGVKQVKLVFYKGQQEKYIIFNGIDSNISNWFQQSRVLESSWPNLASDTFQFFSIEGDFARNFFTTYPYDSCETDTFYTLVVEGMTEQNNCLWEDHASYPKFFFATGDGPGNPDGMLGMALADLFAIFIK